MGLYGVIDFHQLYQWIFASGGSIILVQHGGPHLFLVFTVRHNVLWSGHGSNRQWQVQGDNSQGDSHLIWIQTLRNQGYQADTAHNKILDSVWAMCRMCWITSREVHKFKACLNASRGQQFQGIHYWYTYAPMVTWFTIRLMLTLVLLHKWGNCTVNFVLAYPQADIDS